MTRTQKTLATLLPMTRGFRGSLAGSFMLRLVSQSAAIAAVVCGVQLVLAVGQGRAGVWAAAGVLLGLATVKGIARYGEQYLGHRVAFILLARLRVALFNALLPQAPAIAAKSGSGDLLSRAGRDIDRLEVFFAHTIVPAVSAVVMSVVTIAAQLVLAGPIAAAVLAVGLILALCSAAIGLRTEAGTSERQAVLGGEMSQFSAETIHGLGDLRGLHGLAVRAQRWRALTDRQSAEVSMSQSIARMRRAVMTSAWLATVIATALLCVVLPDALGGVTAAAGAIALAFAAFAAPESVVGFVNEWRAVQSASTRVSATMHADPAVRFLVDHSASATVAAESDQVTAEGLTIDLGPLKYRHTGHGASVRISSRLHISAGQRVLLSGPSGSGKSTLVDLIARVHDPDSGVIAVGGRDLRQLNRTELTRTVAIVDQSTFLFDSTIAWNLRVADPQASDQRLGQICASVGLGDLLQSLPAGLQTRLGRGHGRTMLSGGQAQRLGLARALLTGAPILLVDEATSQLDARTAADIRELVLAERSGRTVIWVSHREAAWEGPVITVGETGEVHLSAESPVTPRASSLGDEDVARSR